VEWNAKRREAVKRRKVENGEANVESLCGSGDDFWRMWASMEEQCSDCAVCRRRVEDYGDSGVSHG
jgi:hypothetical protein